jgi:hypothetical protein
MAQYGNQAPAYGPDLPQGPLILKLTIEEMTGKRHT